MARSNRNTLPTTVAEVRELIDNVRELNAQRILASITPEGQVAPPTVRAAVP